jgi:hypothetical protein
VAARPDAEAQRGVMALRDEGKPALPTGVPMSKLDGGTWRQPATGGKMEQHVGEVRSDIAAWTGAMVASDTTASGSAPFICTHGDMSATHKGQSGCDAW